MIRSRGNILFLILLAVVLFAALASAVTSSLRGGGKDASNENATAAAADILSWLKQVDQAVMRMMLVGGIPLEKIDFDDVTNLYQDGTINRFNNLTCVTAECEVFNVNGGGVAPRKFDKYGESSMDLGTTNARKPGHMSFQVASMMDLGSPAFDVGTRIDFIKLPICKAFNRQLSLPDCPGITQTGGLVTFAGDSDTINTKLSSGSPYTFTGNDIRGRTTFCACVTSSNYGQIWHMVVER